jgi:hypothetical protein
MEEEATSGPTNLKLNDRFDQLPPHKRAFFTSLPQTQEELDDASIYSADYQIKEYVMQLLQEGVQGD